MNPKYKILSRTPMMFLISTLAACTHGFIPLSAQSDTTSPRSASEDYQEFQSCLSNAEVDGYVSEQQIRDCFAPIYNTGTAAAGPVPSDTSSGDEDPSSSSSGSESGDSSDDEETENDN
jgi:hypothetical protein